MQSKDKSIEVRVKQSFTRIGSNSVESICVADGHVTLVGRFDSSNERAITIAVARTVAGVIAVTAEESGMPQNA